MFHASFRILIPFSDSGCSLRKYAHCHGQTGKCNVIHYLQSMATIVVFLPFLLFLQHFRFQVRIFFILRFPRFFLHSNSTVFNFSIQSVMTKHVPHQSFQPTTSRLSFFVSTDYDNRTGIDMVTVGD